MVRELQVPTRLCASTEKSEFPGRALKRTRSKCPTPRLIYMWRFADNVNLAGNIPFVLYRQHWWRQEWWLALAPMRMASKDPALVSTPNWAIRGIRVVGEHNRGRVSGSLGEYPRRIKTRSPKVVESNEL